MTVGRRAHSAAPPPTRRLHLASPVRRKRLRAARLAVLLIAALATVACGLVAHGTAQTPTVADKPTPIRVLRRAAPRTARQQPTAKELAGERIIYSYAGLRPPASLFAAIRAGEAAGVIFFGPNISSRVQLHGVIDQLQRAARRSVVHAPLLMLTDQEGGEVRRLPGPPLASERQIGAHADGVALAGAAGHQAGLNLASAGMNVNLAPVLDVYHRPGNFIDQFQRSYSSNPRTVADLGAAFIHAQQRTRVAATAKHFPGLGDAAQAQNTDVRPVTLNLPLAELRAVDEAPYQQAIAAGVKLVMTSWAVYPALDPRRPAGLSSTVIQHELRDRLGFRGVAITDGIDAGAVVPYGNLARRGLLAAQAGADLILCAATNPANNTPSLGRTVLNAIASALAHHQISLRSAQQAYARVIALRAQP